MTIGSNCTSFNFFTNTGLDLATQSFALGVFITAWGIFRYSPLITAPLFNEEKKISTILVMVFIILTLGISSAGYIYYNHYEKKFRAELENQLYSIAELKLSEIVQWRKERLGDANILYRNPVFTALVRRFYSNSGDAEAERDIRIWLNKIQSSYQYENVLLCDSSLNIRMSARRIMHSPIEHLSKHLSGLTRSWNVAFLDFHRDAQDAPIHLSIKIPVIDEGTNRLLGYVLYFINPETYLYPLIQRWPTSSESGETLLVRREDYNVLYLNELKFRKNTALNFRIPLSNYDVPAVMAVKGETGIVEGKNYRNVPVIAALLSVPDSPWSIVSLIEKEEVYAPLRSILWNLITVICLLIAGAGAGVGLLWHRLNIRMNRERFESAKLLKETEQKYFNLYNKAQAGLYETDLQNGTIISCNQRFCDITGFNSIQSALGNSIESLFFNLSDSEELKNIIKGLGFFTDLVVQLINRHTGAAYWVEMTEVADQNRNLSEGSIIDITERKHAEEELKNYRNHLEDMVKLRTEELEKAKEEAESANRAKSAFLSNMSHEIRTPLNAILGFSQLMQIDKEATPVQLKRLDTVIRSGEHLLALINDILEVSRIEAGRISFSPSTFDIHSFLKDIEAMFRVKTDAKNLSLVLEFPEDLPRYIVTDEGKLRQILINLVGNAVKFTKTGTIGIKVNIKPVNNKKLFTAEVEDSGPGISEKDLDKLFQKFGQTETGIREGGTGLGLAISQQYAKLMLGVISVKSEFGKGSCFTLTIPVEEDDKIFKNSPKRRIRGLKPGCQTYKILIADDHIDNRKLLAEMLTSAGFSIEEAGNGLETINKYTSFTPDLILMDIQMPVMDGYEAISRIRKIETKKIPIIAVTAGAFQDDKKKALECGADAYIRKPFKEHELFDLIKLYLDVDYNYAKAGEC